MKNRGAVNADDVQDLKLSQILIGVEISTVTTAMVLAC